MALMQSPQVETELSRHGSLARRSFRKTPNRSQNELSLINQEDEEDGNTQNSQNLLKDDDVALMQSPQLETELSRRGSLVRRSLRKTPNRSQNGLSSPNQEDEEDGNTQNSQNLSKDDDVALMQSPRAGVEVW